MANNELSGPVVLNGLLSYINQIIQIINIVIDLSYSQRRLSIAYLSKYLKNLKGNLICGFSLSCLEIIGYSYVKTPLKIHLLTKQ